MALDICGTYEKKLIITGRDTGATSAQFADYIMETLTDGNLENAGCHIQIARQEINTQ